MSVEPSDARARAERREAARQEARAARQAEAAARKRTNSSDADADDDPNDPLAADRRAWRERMKAKNAATGGDPEDDGDTLENRTIRHAHRLQAENKSTLKNTIKVARETAEVGAATIHQLNEQTEQFNRMENTIDATDDSLGRSERILRGMKSIGGALRNAFSSSKPKKAQQLPARSTMGEGKDDASSVLAEKDRARIRKKEIEEEEQRAGTPGFRAASARMEEDLSTIPDVTGRAVVPPNAKQKQAIAQLEANQREEDEALDELSDVLGTLKMQSQVMNRQLTEQTVILDKLGDKVVATTDRLKKGSHTMSKIS